MSESFCTGSKSIGLGGASSLAEWERSSLVTARLTRRKESYWSLLTPMTSTLAHPGPLRS